MRLTDYAQAQKRPRKADRQTAWLLGFPAEILEYTAIRVRLSLPEPPSANDWWRMYRGKMVKTPLAKDYQNQVKKFLEAHQIFAAWRGVALFPDQPIAVNMVWYRGRKAGDLDKRQGITLDALQGIIYGNDSQIVGLTAARVDGEKPPRMEVTVKVAA